ncbi:N-acetylglucosamine-6-phosphate deacetylase [Nakamurella deserti]|uniref:N-acetylglucosamine-6-phosphate deacetylase n=1 Tax=Nakamurella deserti TaxID=2164074 RepID=UPI000DBE477D|nr:N-acetylglucosamine-6-phosphate deacetylase [Nakamurella deserti]
MLITAATVVTGTGLSRPGWLEAADGRVIAVGAGAPPRPADLDLGSVTVVPGFVDMHVHGGGGGAFPEATAAASRAAVELHRRHGTTSMVASLVTAAPDTLLRQVAVLADQVGDGDLVGLHLEGPWLSPRRCGAHEVGALRDPDAAELDRVLAAGRGTIRMVTLAPERRGGTAAIRRLVDAGVVAAVGHTDASYDQVRDAIAAGATVGTHLFNAMRPVHHREPGPVLALLEDPRVTVELINDGVHLHPALYREVTRAAGADRTALVTDAMAAAGMSDGDYVLGPLPVTVTDGVARVVGTDTIAGSTATMDGVFRGAVTHCGRPLDEALLLAVRQTSTTPARALGLSGAGLAVGGPADLVVLDDGLAVTGVFRRGVRVR